MSPSPSLPPSWVPAPRVGPWHRRAQNTRHIVTSSLGFVAGLPACYFALGGRGAVWATSAALVVLCAWAAAPVHLPGRLACLLALLAFLQAGRAGARSQHAARTRRRLAWQDHTEERRLRLQALLHEPVVRSIPTSRSA